MSISAKALYFCALTLASSAMPAFADDTRSIGEKALDIGVNATQMIFPFPAPGPDLGAFHYEAGYASGYAHGLNEGFLNTYGNMFGETPGPVVISYGGGGGDGRFTDVISPRAFELE